MKLTHHEIMLLVALLTALLMGMAVKRYRETHPPADPVSMGIRGR